MPAGRQGRRAQVYKLGIAVFVAIFGDMTPGARWARAGTAVAALLLVSAGLASAQFGRGVRFGVRFAPPDLPDRGFTICRIMYTSVRREADGAGWQTDYPLGDNNVLIRLGELTRTRISQDARRQPNHWVVRLTDDALFNCPYAVASDVGTMGLSGVEVERLRAYLLKGGFLWVDDFWGTAAWEHWSRVIGEVLPGRPIEDVPLTDPIFQSQFAMKSVPQVPRYPFWVATGGQTSERGEDSRVPHFRAIRDDHGRIMVVMTHNTDIADSWEREAEEPAYFQRFSVTGYALAVDVLLYAQTH
jgi:hypothetical protein